MVKDKEETYLWSDHGIIYISGKQESYLGDIIFYYFKTSIGSKFDERKMSLKDFNIKIKNKEMIRIK